MRKRLTVLLTLLLVLAACGTDATDSSDTAGGGATAQPDTPAEETAADMSDDEDMSEDDMADEEMSDEAMGDLVDVAGAEEDLMTFLTALEAAGIMDDLRGEGPFTIFAPSDDAFASYLAEAGMSMDDVFGDREMLGSILENHIVATNDDSAMVMNMAGEPFISLSGLPLDVTVNGDVVMVNAATVLRYDLQASNGFIHVIDRVLGSA